MTDQTHRLAQAWTTYWQSGESASCHRGGLGEVSFEALWRAFFDLCHNTDVLDLATGNGTVARWAVASAKARRANLRVTGVDAADINPAAAIGDSTGLLSEIRFLGGVALEALPFKAESFGALSSQFGFEYADEVQAATEVCRVLKTGGTLRFVMHASGGEVSRDITERVERLMLALGDDGFLIRLRNAARKRVAGLPEVPAPLLHEAWTRTQVLRQAPPTDDAALFYVEGLATLWNNRARYGAEDLLTSVEDGIARAQAVLLRQQALLKAARSQDEIASLRERFVALGVATEPALPLRDEDGRQIGWLMDGKK